MKNDAANVLESDGAASSADDIQSTPRDEPASFSLKRRHWLFGGYLALLIVGFHQPLLEWIRHSASDELHSHVILIPVISLYLIWIQRKQISVEYRFSWGLASSFLIIALASLFLALSALPNVFLRDFNDYLAAMIVSLVSLIIGGAYLAYGGGTVRSILFPVAFLYFCTPMPTFLIHSLETFLQNTSADALHFLLNFSGTPFFRDGIHFLMPNIGTITVAPECSGIRSTFILFITSLLAGYLFLSHPRFRVYLAAAALPLGVIRNGFRILTIVLLCVHVDPSIMDGPVHNQGGPPFFVLSLMPLFGLVYLLRKLEKKS